VVWIWVVLKLTAETVCSLIRAKVYPKTTIIHHVLRSPRPDFIYLSVTSEAKSDWQSGSGFTSLASHLIGSGCVVSAVASAVVSAVASVIANLVASAVASEVIRAVAGVLANAGSGTSHSETWSLLGGNKVTELYRPVSSAHNREVSTHYVLIRQLVHFCSEPIMQGSSALRNM
jgi:hypothetical protein